MPWLICTSLKGQPVFPIKSWAVGTGQLLYFHWRMAWHDCVFLRVVANADWSNNFVRFRLIILISRRWSKEKKKSWSQTRTVEFGVERRFFKNRRLWRREECLKIRGRDWKPSSGRSTRRPSFESSTSWKRGERMNVVSWTAISRWATSTGWMLTVSISFNDTSIRWFWVALFHANLSLIFNK